MIKKYIVKMTLEIPIEASSIEEAISEAEDAVIACAEGCDYPAEGASVKAYYKIYDGKEIINCDSVTIDIPADETKLINRRRYSRSCGDIPSEWIPLWNRFLE